VNAQNLQSSVEASGQFKLLVQDGYQQICRNSYPNLSVYRVVAFDDIAQTMAPSHLSKDHANQLLAHSKMPHPRIGMKARSLSGEGLAMNQIEDLGENKAAGYHPRSIESDVPKNSNPSHSFFRTCL
jgi:hypothetical protein